ncbi:MAG: glycosyltransferase family 39 protein [Chloroflexi bacterium]|nr:glycosyltransferase family 39 protein [Chloroflexota bacterium]
MTGAGGAILARRPEAMASALYRASGGQGAMLLACSLCLLALLLRLPSPNQQLEYDEVISILFARQDFGRIVEATAADTMPPLYYWLLRLWHGEGSSLFMARYLSTILGVLSLPALYVLGRRLLGEGTALLGTAILALSPFHVFYSHYTRMYALLALLALLAATFFLAWLQDGGRRSLALATLATGLALYVHPLAFLLVATLDLLFVGSYLLKRAAPLQAGVGTLLAANAALGLGFLPWLVYLPGQVEKVTRAFWIPTPGPTELVRTAIVFHFHLPLPAGWLGPAAFLSLLLVTVTAVELRRRWLAALGERAGLLALLVLALAPLALIYLVSQVRPIYVERAALAAAAAYYLLLAAALRWLPLRPVAWALGALLLLGMLVANVYQWQYQSFPRSPLGEVARYLAQEVRPGDMVLHDNKLSFFPAYYFAPGLPQSYVADPPGSPNDTLAPGTTRVLGLSPTTPEEAARGHRRLWFVAFDRALAEAAAAGRPLPNKAALDARSPGALQAHIGDVSLYLYRREP